MSEWVMGLREHVHSAVLTLTADSPLIHNAHLPGQATPLEIEHAALVVGMAHQARMVMQLRGLDTGVARDVSGVLRVSKGGSWVPESEPKSGDDSHQVWEEREILYFVQGDGAVRVFGRGESM
jgi:elongator complex protein 6